MFEIAAVGLVESDRVHDSEKGGEEGGKEKGEKEKTPFASEGGFCGKKQKIHMKGLVTTINDDIENAGRIDLWRSR